MINLVKHLEHSRKSNRRPHYPSSKFYIALTCECDMGSSETKPKYCDDFISMVTPDKAWPFCLQEAGSMLVLIQEYRGASIW